MALPPSTPAGYMVDTGLYGSAVQDALESVQDLTWPSNVHTYSRMRRDPQIAATLNAYALPIRAATWAVDPEGCRPEVAQYAADAWGLPVLGDPNPTRNGARRRGVLWKAHIRVALLMLVYGHMSFAWAGETLVDADGFPLKFQLTRVDERLPHTIAEINVDRNGDLESIVQYGEERAIPARNLLWYVHEREGANWRGTSMMREAYGPWLLKHDMWRVLGISSRRFGMGVPYVNAPAGATDAEVEKGARMAEAARVGDQSGAGLPDGFKFNLAGLVGSTPDTLGFVKYLDSQIAQGVLASVLNLPNSDSGNRALGDTLVGLLRLSWEAVADDIATPATQLTTRLIDIQYGEEEPAPEIVCTGLGRPEPTAEAIGGLIGAGAIHSDPQLENWLRERYQLPEIDPDFVPKPGIDRAGGPEAPPPPAPGAPPVPAAEPPSAPSSEAATRIRITSRS